jgi:hypothetical protein
MDRLSLVALALALALPSAGCLVMHVPPPAHPGAPMTPVTAAGEGLDVGVGGSSYLSVPIAYHARAAKAFTVAEGPFTIELGGNLGSGWAALNPALHWAPEMRPGSRWHPGLRLGLVAGSGDILGYEPFAAPFVGASLHAQGAWADERGRVITTSLGWGYTGHTRCLGGCSYTVPSEPDSSWCDEEDPASCETTHAYSPFNAPSLHLRADFPVGHAGHSVFVGLGTQPVLDGDSLLPILELSAGLNKGAPQPRWAAR